MRSILLFVAFMAALAFALPASAERYVLYPHLVTKVPTCSSGGGSSVSVPRGSYILTVSVGDVALCYAATCTTGGATLVAGTQIPVFFNGSQTVSCRSSSSGAVEFVRADRG